jgi:murein DD-endopeptidase MepM/ murein hydrolase activator NlpD
MSDVPLNLDRIPAAGPGLGPAQEARNGDREKLKDLAQQFEAMLLNQMLRGMRQSMLEEETGGLGSDTMTSTFDQELSLSMSRAGGFGLADELLKALDRGTPAAGAVDGERATPPAPALAAPGQAGQGLTDAEAESGVANGVEGLLGGLGPLSSGYGMRMDPFGQGPRFHAGVDIAAAYGREVPVAAAGRVVEAGDSGAYGTSVVVEHSGGVRTRYAHMSALNVTTGQDVAAGQVIGRVGQTGRATGPHLHFEVLEGGRPIDPEELRARSHGH